MEIQLFIQDFQIQVVDSKRDTTWSNDYLHLKKLMDNGVLDNNLKTWKYFANEGTGMLFMTKMLVEQYFLILKKIK